MRGQERSRRGTVSEAKRGSGEGQFEGPREEQERDSLKGQERSRRGKV